MFIASSQDFQILCTSQVHSSNQSEAPLQAMPKACRRCLQRNLHKSTQAIILIIDSISLDQEFKPTYKQEKINQPCSQGRKPFWYAVLPVNHNSLNQSEACARCHVCRRGQIAQYCCYTSSGEHIGHILEHTCQHSGIR